MSEGQWKQLFFLKQEYGAERLFRGRLRLLFRGRAFGATGRFAGDFFLEQEYARAELQK